MTEIIAAADGSTVIEVAGERAIAQIGRSPDIAGIEIESLGRAWKLAPVRLAPAFREARDELYEDILFAGEVDTARIFLWGYACLLANYELEPDEIGEVLRGADREELVAAVIGSVIFSEYPEVKKSYSYWAETALIANGLDPAQIRPENLPGVLEHLVRTGRAVPDGDFTGPGRFAAERQGFLGGD